jgi:hypothetical protein
VRRLVRGTLDLLARRGPPLAVEAFRRVGRDVLAELAPRLRVDELAAYAAEVRRSQDAVVARMAEALASLRAHSDELAASLMARLDPDGDGRVPDEDFLPAYTAWMADLSLESLPAGVAERGA